jgi:hypothetical protein
LREQLDLVAGAICLVELAELRQLTGLGVLRNLAGLQCGVEVVVGVVAGAATQAEQVVGA